MSTTEPRLRRGVFITIEGLDGCGKTTQLERLAARLRDRGFDVEQTVEPGGTRIGGEIRRILLDARNQEIVPVTELLLYFASRAQNVAEKIRPGLEAGKIVLSDRYTDSTLVYQGMARGLGEQVVRQLHEIACGGLDPDLTLYLDIDPEAGLARARNRNRNAQGAAAGQTRMDEQSAEFYRRVREGYRELARREPRRVRLIDAARSIEEVERDVWATVSAFLEKLHV